MTDIVRSALSGSVLSLLSAQETQILLHLPRFASWADEDSILRRTTGTNVAYMFTSRGMTALFSTTYVSFGVPVANNSCDPSPSTVFGG